MSTSGPSPIALTGFINTVYSLLGYTCSPLIVTLVSVVLIVILCTLIM